jgi:N-carbamoylputrescine amidase
MQVLTAEALPSLCPSARSDRSRSVTVGLVQTRWHEDAAEHRRVLAEGVADAAQAGAKIVFLQELTMMRYMADTRPTGSRSASAESLEDGPSVRFLREQAQRNGIFINGSIFEKTGADAEHGYNTSVLVSPAGELVQRTRKMHIPVTSGYYEDEYFAPGPAASQTAGQAASRCDCDCTGSGVGDPSAPNPYPVVSVDLPGTPHLGLPTCWDEWFPETARLYGLGGAEMLSYPTAIGSEPDYPDFNTEPLWEQVIRGNAIANGLFMVVPNRYGNEGTVTFYGSSFICDPFGRMLVQAPREGDAVLVAQLDLAQREDWLTLFPFYATRRPESYAPLMAPLAAQPTIPLMPPLATAAQTVTAATPKA